MSTLLEILFNPVMGFDKLKKNDTFSFVNLFITLVVMLFSLILNAPIKEKASMILLSSMNLPNDQIDNMIQVMYKMRYLQIINGEMLGLASLVFNSVVIYILIIMLKRKMRFKLVFHLIVLISPILYLGDIINSIMIYIIGINNMSSPYDALMFGANKLVPISSISTILYTFMSYINPFQIWFICLLCIALRILMKIGYAKSFAISILFWFISVALPTLSMYFSDLARDKAISIL